MTKETCKRYPEIMKKSLFGFSAVITLLWPVVSNAQLADGLGAGQFESLLINILAFANQILLPFIIGIGFLVFVWGVFVYFIVGGGDEEKRAQGRSFVVYSILGYVLIIIFYGVVNMIADSIGLEGETLQNIPSLLVP